MRMIDVIAPSDPPRAVLPRGASHRMRTGLGPSALAAACRRTFLRRGADVLPHPRQATNDRRPQWTYWQGSTALAPASNVLEHPFYARWSGGELSAAELRVYAGQYRHAVVALADASDAAAAQAAPAERRGPARARRPRSARTSRCGTASRPPAAPVTAGRAADDARVRERLGGGRRPARPPGGAVRDRGRPAGDLEDKARRPARALRLRARGAGDRVLRGARAARRRARRCGARADRAS